MKINLQKTNRQIRKFEQEIIRCLNSGMDVKKAVAAAYQQYPIMFTAQKEIEKLVYKAAEDGLGAPIQEELFSDIERKWAPDRLTLSERTTKASEVVLQLVAKEINQAITENKNIREVAKKIYEGYSVEGIIPEAERANYIDEVVSLAKSKNIASKDFKLSMKKARENINKLSTKGLQAAYNQVQKAIEDANYLKLEKAVYAATQEKTRYIAERIARTEMRRAYLEGYVARYKEDPDIIGYQWKLSTRHPCYDICDVYANADLYGMGEGIFPKDKLPMMPAHPHCMCKLKPIVAGSIDNEVPKDNIATGGQDYLKTVSDEKLEKILGIEGAKKFKKGEDWRQYARGYTENEFGNSFSVGKNGKVVYNEDKE